MWTRRLLALVLGLVLTAAALEVAFRVAGVRPPTFEQERAAGEAAKAAHEAVLRRNAEGFHDTEWVLEKPPGTRRLFVLGDSFTESPRVPLAETFVQRVQAGLNADAPDGARHELYSIARGGWGTSKQLEWLTRMLPHDPDAVLLVYFINDATGMGSNPAMAEELAQRIYRREGVLNRVSRAWDWFDYRHRRRSVTVTTFEDYEASFTGSPKAQRKWTDSKRALEAMAELADERGLPFAVAVFPVLVELEGPAEEHSLLPLYEKVTAHCASLGVPATILLEPFLGQRPTDLWVSPINAHPNARAHALVSPALEAFVRSAGLVGRRAPTIPPGAAAEIDGSR